MHTPLFIFHLEHPTTLQRFFLRFFFDESLSLGFTVELAASFLFLVADGVLLFWTTTFGMMCNFCSDGVTTSPPPSRTITHPPTAVC
jgi:hypothetical protein